MINHDRSTRRLVLNTANALSWLSEIKERDTERMMNATTSSIAAADKRIFM